MDMLDTSKQCFMVMMFTNSQGWGLLNIISVGLILVFKQRQGYKKQIWNYNKRRAQNVEITYSFIALYMWGGS